MEVEGGGGLGLSISSCQLPAGSSRHDEPSAE